MGVSEQSFLSDVWYKCPKPPKKITAGYDEKRYAHAKLFPHVQQLEEDQRDIHVQNTLHSKLYTNREPFQFDWNHAYQSHFRPLSANLENVIQSACDTLLSRIGSNRPKATIQARGAKFDDYMRARQLDRFIWAEFVYHKIHAKMKRVFLDGCLYGTGVLKIDIDKTEKEIFVERVHPDEIIVDQRECISNEMPNQIHHRKLVSRLWLLETYGKKDAYTRKKILEAQSNNFRYTSYKSPGLDQIIVVESWKLETRPGSNDGRHVICIENCTLVDEDYTRKRFPFVFYKWAEPQSGFYGRSLVGDLVGYQLRQNDLNETIRIGQDLMVVPRFFVEQGSDFHAEQLDNQIAKIYRYRGQIPEAVTFQAFNDEIYNERDRNPSKAMQFAGVSEQSAQLKLPNQTRMDSAEAFREVTAIEDARFNDKTQAWEASHIDVADHLIELNSLLYRTMKKSRKAHYSQRYIVEQIDWKNVDMKADRYVLEISASSILNMSPAARKDILANWMQLGVISPQEYKAWSGQPDLERLADMMSAAKDYTEYMINEMLKEKAMMPDPLMNLSEAFPVVHDTYQHLRVIDAPDNVVDIFVAWLENAKEMMQPTPSPDMMGAPAGAGMPPAGPPMGAGPAPAQMAPPMGAPLQ